jgi:SAM-dependent methyltransferase
MHENSQLLFENFAKPFFRKGMRVLEIGPDRFPSTYRKIINIEDITWDTLDIFESPFLTYPKSQLYSFPISNNTYDIVLSGQVIEHVAKVWVWMKELARITKAGGLVITINPISWPYHEAPIDCWRIYPEGMKAISEDAGLSVEKVFWGSLELPRFTHALPGRSPKNQGRKIKYMFRLLGLFGLPVEKSFDNIAIARKRV